MAIRKISPDKLQETLRLHQLWLNNRATGQCANLSDADLRGANLRGAYLSGAYLRRADLQGADLRGADLRGADLRSAYLRHANLRGANLDVADLRGTDLRGAICDSNIQKAWVLEGSKWLCSDVPWWLGHKDQDKIILCDQ